MTLLNRLKINFLSILCCYTFILAVCTDAFSQQGGAVDAQLVALGDELYNFGDANDALDLYLQALENNPKNVRANYMAGKCYLETFDKHKSVPFLLKAYELNKNISPDILYKIGMGYQFGADFDKAIKYFTLHKENLTPSKLEKMQTGFSDEQTLCERRIYECKNGLEYYTNPKNFEIKNLGNIINSEYAEYAPAITSDQKLMIFTSRREGGVGKNKDVDNEYFEDIWYSRKVNGEWLRPKNVGKNINTESHDASIGFSPDGKILFVYKPDNGGDIYFSTQINDSTWGSPQNLGNAINSKYAEPSVCISSDGNTLLFASDRPGGVGRKDLYMSKKLNDGRWGKPQNLGSMINTIYDEDSPYLDLDGKTLYFSSRGHKGMGGYDVYKTVWDATLNKWSSPENLGYPINSPDDDIYFVISGDGKTGYYASAKEGGLGKNDIYSISMQQTDPLSKFEMITPSLPIVKDSVKSLTIMPSKPNYPFAVFKGKVTDEQTGEKIQAKIEISDIKTLQTTANNISLPDGSFEIVLLSGNNYAVEVEKDGYLFYSTNLEIPFSNDYQLIFKDIALKKASKGNKIVLKNVFFDSGKTKLRKESVPELNVLIKLLKENPMLKIEISGHSDNIGSAETNKKLSTERAKEVYNHLIMNGIPKERLRYAGYGKERPIADNGTESGRQENRRTEFEVIEN